MPDTRRGNASAMMLMVVLIILSLAVSYLAWHAHDQSREILDGRTGGFLKISPKNSLATHNKAIADLTEELADLRAKREQLRGRLHYYNLQLAGHGHFLASQGWIGGDQSRSAWTFAREDVQAQQERLQVWDDSYADPDRHSFKALNGAIDQGRDTVDTINDRITREEDTFNTTRDRLISEQDRLHDRRDELNKASRLRYAELSIKKSKLESRIRELLELSLKWLEDIAADGEVLESVSDGQHVVLNLGEVDDIHPGMRFEIFTWTRGQHLVKGMVEVIEVGSRVSTARVLNSINDERHPISRGDLVGNPIYDRERPHTFVLAGEFTRFNASDLGRFIERAGGIVRDKLDPNVDFLVAGMRSESEQNVAREYRVVAMREEDLLRFLDTTFRPE